MDIRSIARLKQAWNRFSMNHPKFPEFLRAVKSRGIHAGMEVSITVTYPDGDELRSGLRIKPSDVELFRRGEQNILNMRYGTAAVPSRGFYMVVSFA